jgi:hypothetical protein
LSPIQLTPEILLLVGLAAVALFLLGRLTAGGSGRLRKLRDELARTETDLATARGESEKYKARVADHFAETSHRLHDLTLQYRAVYDHLAQGANELCPEGFEKLEGGLGLDALGAGDEGEPVAAASADSASSAGTERVAPTAPAEAAGDAQPEHAAAGSAESSSARAESERSDPELRSDEARA